MIGFVAGQAQEFVDSLALWQIFRGGDIEIAHVVLFDHEALAVKIYAIRGRSQREHRAETIGSSLGVG